MQQKKSINFGFRGWMLILYQAIAFMTFTVFTNYPMNILSQTGFYPDSATMTPYYTVGCLVGIVVQLVLSRNVGKIKSIKWLSALLGVGSVILAILIMVVSPAHATAWLIIFGLESFVSTMYCTFAIGILCGQWFPRRKGTVMGIATIAFPLSMAVIGYGFATPFFARFGAGMETQMGDKIGQLIGQGVDASYAEFLAGSSIAQASTFRTFIPFLIISIIGLLLGLIFVTDYPEQCGAFRDNDRTLAPEMAKQMMLQEIEDKKTTVWKPSKVFKLRDFWFGVVPIGVLLVFSVGMATQTNPIIGQFETLDYNIIMLAFAGCGIGGSYVLGLLDTKFGTKRAITISSCFAILSGVVGLIHTPAAIVASMCFLGLFIGATSNYSVSFAAQYWRREDFSSVYTCLNPIGNLFNSFGPILIANLLFMRGVPNSSFVFAACLIGGIIALVLILLFKPSHVKEVDDVLREKAGKPLDNALAGRK